MLWCADLSDEGDWGDDAGIGYGTEHVLVSDQVIHMP